MCLRPAQLLLAFDRAMQVLTDPASCGPVTLALCQDVQAEAFNWPRSLFEERLWCPRRSPPARDELAQAVQVLRASQRPLIVCGGGVLYSEAGGTLREFCERHGIPSGETQAGKSALPGSHPLNLGGIGVTGTAAANSLGADADVVLAVGTRLQDFTTGSATLFDTKGCRILALNVQPLDAGKHGAIPLIADAREGWLKTAQSFTAASDRPLPSDAEVIGAVQRAARASDIVVCSAGGLPGELHRHWQAEQPLGYHLEYGFSCMGYEIAGGLGVKLAQPEREVIVMVGDGSYLMLNSEIATSVAMGLKLIVVLLDNGGFGCIERLQRSTGNASFNNLRRSPGGAFDALDFVAHARSLGAAARKVKGCAELGSALAEAREADRTSVLVIE